MMRPPLSWIISRGGDRRRCYSRVILPMLLRRATSVRPYSFDTSTTASTAAKATSPQQYHLDTATSNDIDDETKKQFLLEWQQLRTDRHKDISALFEYEASCRLHQFLNETSSTGRATSLVSLQEPGRPPTPPRGGYTHTLTNAQINVTIDACLAAFCLHTESRIAALLGVGYYTIGPCGEETLAAAAHAIHEPNDSLALHYRHLAINLARQLILKGSHQNNAMEQILLDRARGYTVSGMDPVTGGVHCSIGSRQDDPNNKSNSFGGEYIVTSTLASQCPPAVGRALGYPLLPSLHKHRETTPASILRGDETKMKKKNPVSFVTLGDGSVHNHHFWSAFHLARHARHKNIKCPLTFGISDNGFSISYKTQGYVDTLFDADPLVPLFKCANANDIMDVYDQTQQAVEYARTKMAPVVVLYSNLGRRFGHAASDRQSAYLDQEQIQSLVEMDVLESAVVQAVEVYNATTYAQVRDRFEEIQQFTQTAFAIASREKKVNRQDMIERVAAPMVAVPPLPAELLSSFSCVSAVEQQQAGNDENNSNTNTANKRFQVMRKLMTRVIDEALQEDDSVVYLGEDVQHGGYYIVTDGLARKFPGRVLDFPPDETSLLGAAVGFSQVGLTPIVEIPYAKYLDCGADMFYEIAVMHWLSNGQRPNGMVIRLQGFDRGLFGGNFHTSNMLQHVPPGVDLVCFSNGEDYVRGFRNALVQAKAGRVVMTVDCTHLLNLRHLYDNKDRAWERCYPPMDGHGVMGFDDIRRYGTQGSWAILSYGNGIVTSLQARRFLFESGVISNEDVVDIIDCPYLSSVPDGLRGVMDQYDGILFADPCKEGPGSSVLASMATSLHGEGLLPGVWKLVAAPRTYNPLGGMSTFLNVDDIVGGAKTIIAELQDVGAISNVKDKYL